MAVLYVRLPDELHRALRDLANDDRRSVNATAIILLERAVAEAVREREGTP